MWASCINMIAQAQSAFGSPNLGTLAHMKMTSNIQNARQRKLGGCATLILLISLGFWCAGMVIPGALSLALGLMLMAHAHALGKTSETCVTPPTAATPPLEAASTREGTGGTKAADLTLASHEEASGPSDLSVEQTQAFAVPAPVEEPVVVQKDTQDRISETTLDFAALSSTLVGAEDPLDALKRFVGDIRTREAEQDPNTAPSGLERYAARRLEEAGLFSSDVELPAIDVVRPHASNMVYLRCLDPRIPYLAKVRIIQIEAALNAIRFASASVDAHASCEDAYRLNQRLARSIVAQAPALDEPLELALGIPSDGEWAVRYGISQAIESLQLPYRLTADFRCNVADGNVAIEFAHTPAEVFPASCYLDGHGIVATTGDMRQQAAADYALRVALLLAASAFRCSPRIRHVWVAAVHENAVRRTCYLSVDFDRWRFAKLDFANLGDLAELYRAFAPVMRYEQGWLRPVKQGFHLEEERFCPSRRYVPVSLSSRKLDGEVAARLGCDHVSALSIEEGDGRALVASAIMMRLAPADDAHATQKNVRTILDLAADDPDPTVRSAAERVVNRLVAGTIEADPFVIGEEFVRGDALTRANDRAKELLMRQQPEEARKAVVPLLDQIDAAGTYADTAQVTYRFFNSYIERALYNRLQASESASSTVLLVPDAYYEAHLLASVTSLMLGMPDDALAHAERLRTLAPLDARGRLHLVRCLEALGRDDEAVDELSRLLEIVHEPWGVGLTYYRMAFFQWKRGNVAAAQACYQLALQYLPVAMPMVTMELSVLYIQHAGELSTEMTRENAEEVIAAYGIPVAPTQETSDAFYECAQASLDAEIFPVARNFALVLGAFSGDDIISGLVRSLEDAPDH